MHTVLLVEDCEEYLRTLSRGTADIRIDDVRFSYEEWLNVLFDVFSQEIKLSPDVKRRILERKAYLELSTMFEVFPLFSRITGFIKDAKYEKDEVQTFREECYEINRRATSPLAKAGLKNLIRICDRALDYRKGIVFLGK